MFTLSTNTILVLRTFQIHRARRAAAEAEADGELAEAEADPLAATSPLAEMLLSVLSLITIRPVVGASIGELA